VPHGSVQYRTVPLYLVEDFRNVGQIYVPPDTTVSPAQFPVLYLLTAAAIPRKAGSSGPAPAIEENLLAEHKTVRC